MNQAEPQNAPATNMWRFRCVMATILVVLTLMLHFLTSHDKFGIPEGPMADVLMFAIMGLWFFYILGEYWSEAKRTLMRAALLIAAGVGAFFAAFGSLMFVWMMRLLIAVLFP